VLADTCGDWLRDTGTLCLVSGMAGSRQGWQERPYCACPAGFGEVARSLRWVEPRRIALVPGLSCESDGRARRDARRGSAGVRRDGPAGAGADGFVLPGTHSKWVRVERARASFATFMSGEMFALLRQHSILARTLPPTMARWTKRRSLRGVRHAQEARSLLLQRLQRAHAGAVRRACRGSAASYLSGLVIGEELRLRAAMRRRIVLVGSRAQPRAMRSHWRRWAPQPRLGAEATWRGLWALARHWSAHEPALAHLARRVAALPLVAILRGIRPTKRRLWATRLHEPAGGCWKCRSIHPTAAQHRALARRFPDASSARARCARQTKCGSVHVPAAGWSCRRTSMRAWCGHGALGMVCLPGVLTPSEAFAGAGGGRTGLKLFPAEMVPPAAVKPCARCCRPKAAVAGGRHRARSMAAYRAAGANGFGIGSALYQPGRAPAMLRRGAGLRPMRGRGRCAHDPRPRAGLISGSCAPGRPCGAGAALLWVRRGATAPPVPGTPGSAGHDLRGRHVLCAAEVLESLLLRRIDQDGQPRSLSSMGEGWSDVARSVVAFLAARALTRRPCPRRAASARSGGPGSRV
jgi:2-dehydro-3-deoxygalactonokinase